MTKKILFIAYYYPPLAGSGVFRPLKMIQYMRDNGFYVDVLTVENIEYHTFDHSLLSESKANHIYRAKSYDPLAILAKLKQKHRSIKSQTNQNKVSEIKGRVNRNGIGMKGESFKKNQPGLFSEKVKKIINSFFPIDNKIGWYFPALSKADELFKTTTYDLVFATIGPYTSAMIAHKISKKYKIPMIIDYRDHWTLNTWKFDYNPFNKILAQYYEKKILNHASLVSVIGDVMKKELSQHFLKNNSDKFITVYNGFEENDFSTEITHNKSEKTVVRYLGSFNANRTVKYFTQALSELIESGYEFTNIIFEFYGNNDTQTNQLLNHKVLKDIVINYPLISHQESIEKIRTANVLLLFISSDDGPGVLTGKLFEYIRSKNMILPMIRQNGEAKALLSKLGVKKTCAMEDVITIKKYIIEINEKRFHNIVSSEEYITEFSRENQCKRLINRISNLFNQTNSVRKTKR